MSTNSGDTFNMSGSFPNANIYIKSNVGGVPVGRTRIHSTDKKPPSNFVQRPAEFEQLLTLLLDPQRAGPVAMTAALRGAGGFGKTTLARAVCCDQRVRQAFDDQILWVTLGESPGNLTGVVMDVIERLTSQRPGFATLEAATARLSELLDGAPLLLVVDDVWQAEHLKPFLQGGPRCTRLITTRNSATLWQTDAAEVNVDAMQPDEAVELLGARLLGIDQVSLRQLAARLGEWPLLLNLVNGALRDRVRAGQAQSEALNYVVRMLDKRGLVAFDTRDTAARERAVRLTIDISLEHLTLAERLCYVELVVFPQDADIPISTVVRLWSKTSGLDDLDTEELCKRLEQLSLLQRYDLASHTIRLHDVVRAYLEHDQIEQMPALHRQLLDAHRPATWAALPPDEPYMWAILRITCTTLDNTTNCERYYSIFGGYGPRSMQLIFLPCCLTMNTSQMTKLRS